jgi:V8-like Glu-specific endopeptidase
MRHRIALLVAPALLLAMLPGVVSAAPPRDPQAAHRAAVLAYWTPARIQAAIPRDFAFDAVRGFVPNARPGSGGGTGAVTGASWTGGGKMLLSTGRALFTLGGTDYICSGSVVDDGSRSDDHAVVLTAGHCVTDNTANSFATNFMFIPQFDTKPTYTCANTQLGCWVASALYADTLFATAGGFNDQAVTHDWGFVRFGPGGFRNQQLDAAVAPFPIQVNKNFNGQTLSAFGYPAAGKYHGSDLVYCKGPVGQDTNANNETWSMACDMTGGSSGGPWVQASAADYSDAILSSLNSYGYSGVKNMYGPKFTSGTTAALGAADAGGQPSGGSGVSWSGNLP